MIYYILITFSNLETDLAQGMTFKGKRSGLSHSFFMDVDPGYKHIEKFRGGMQWYMMETKCFISNVSLKSKNENGKLV